MTVVEDVFVGVAGPDPVVQRLVGGLVIAMLNLLGAMLILVLRNPAERTLDTALGFAAGVMLAASFTSLIVPGIDFASAADYAAIAIGVQNIPEGLAVSIAAITAGLDRLR